VTSAAILTQYSTIQELADWPLLELEGLLRTLSHNHLPDAADNARKLHEVAVNSFPVPPGMVEPLNLLLRSSLDHIRFLEAQRAEFEAAIERAFTNVPELAWLLTIPGVGLIIAACLLAELCPFDRFFNGTITDRATGRQRPNLSCRTRQGNARDAEASIAKWAGLWWPRHQSGVFEGEITRLPKDGNAYFRYAVIQAANCIKEHAAEYSAFYTRKYDETPKHAHKRALVLTARKVIGLLVALLHTGQPYRTPEAYRNVPSLYQTRRQSDANPTSVSTA
jgi:hypothetical protein